MVKMVSAKQMDSNQQWQQQRLIHANKPRLLIVSDSAERSNNLKAILGSREIEITQVASIEELSRACDIGHHIAVVESDRNRLSKCLNCWGVAWKTRLPRCWSTPLGFQQLSIWLACCPNIGPCPAATMR
jgi:hypothetical protein